MMFIVPCPSCGRCGCECGRLPYTVTATFSDLDPRNRTAECELLLSSCFGSGATAVVMQPGGCTNTPTCGCDGSDAGPITEVLLTNGGSCYATFGREEPTVLAFASVGTGAELEVTLTQGTDDCGLPAWSASSVSVIEPGSGYVLGLITLTVVAPGIESQEAFAEITALTHGDGIDEVTVTFPGEYYLPNRDLPALSAVVTIFDGTCVRSGSAAEITATVDDDVDSDTFGQVISLNIVNGGGGYLSWTYLPGCLDRLNGESLVLRASDPHKLITLEVQSCYGSGACLEVKTFLPPCEYDGAPTELPGVILTSGGEGYAKLGRVEPTLSLAAENGVGATLTPTLDKKADNCGLDYWYIDTVATKGGTGYLASNIVKVSVTKGVEEEPAALTLTASEGVPTGVTIERAGKYYLESNAIAAYTPSIKVAVVQLPPSVGTGAAVTVTVNTDPLAGDFGKITGVSLTNKGSGYLLLGGPKYCEYEGPCNTTLDFAGGTVVGLLTGTFNKSDPQPDCDDISSETTIQRGLTAGTVNVEAGGLWSLCAEQDCGECPDECPEEVTVTVSVCGETITFTMPTNGGSGGADITLEVPVAVPPEPQQGGGYILINAASGCQSDGCGYEVGVTMCYSCRRALDTDPVIAFGEFFRGCIESEVEDGCPVAGAVGMVCIGGECGASVTVSVS